MLRALLVALLLSACSPDAPIFNSTDVTGATWGRDFHLTDTSAKPRSVNDFKGNVVVLFFGYTQCPDVCPTTMSKLSDVTKRLRADADRVQVLFVTLDPERDTPQLLAQYVPSFDARFAGLYGTPDVTAATAKEFKIFYQKQPGSKPGSYTIDHTAGMYAFDPKGRLRLFIRDDESSEKIASDLKILLAGQ